MAEEKDWRRAAIEAYRDAREDLERWKNSSRPEVPYYVEELMEALLDLKQATIAEDSARVARCVTEVKLLQAELRDLAEGD